MGALHTRFIRSCHRQGGNTACQDSQSGRKLPLRELGATTVEFAFAMVLLTFFFIAYVEIIEIFLAHERVTYAAFKASRAHQVGGNAYLAAASVDSRFMLETNDESVTVSKYIPLPIDFYNPFSGDVIREQGMRFRVSTKVPTFDEPEPSGDN